MQQGPDTAPRRRRAQAVTGVVAAILVALAVAGCGSVGHTDGGDRTTGKELFTKGVAGAPSCGSCHALADAGTSGQVGPDLDYAFLQARRDGLGESTVQQVVLDQIYYPTEETPTGAPGMPAVDTLLPECGEGEEEGCVEDQEEAAEGIAAYVASVAGLEEPGTSPAPPPAPAPPAAQPPAAPAPGGDEEGRQVFASAGCGSCHTLADAGSNGQVGPNLDDSAPDEALVADRVANGRGAMPPFKGQLSDEEIAAVARYVAQVAGK